MARKLFLIIFINIIIFSILYTYFYNIVKKDSDFSYGILGFKYHYDSNEELDPNVYLTEHKPDYFKRLPSNQDRFMEFCGENRTIIGEKYQRNPIVVIGGSYAYGHGLKKEQTFSYLLSEITKRPVYNFSACGASAIDSVYLFREYQDNIKDSDYIVYIYMWDHTNRFLHIKSFMELYNDVEKSSVFDKLLEKNYVAHYMNMKMKQHNMLDDYPKINKSSNYLKRSIIHFYKLVKPYVPNAKMIIILYNEKISDEYNKEIIKYVTDMMNSNIWKEIEEETNGDIKVVRTKDILGFVFDKDYKLDEDIEDWHPNAKAWEVLTPGFAEKYIEKQI